MIEGEGDFVSEEDMMRAIEVGHEAVITLCVGEPSASFFFLFLFLFFFPVLSPPEVNIYCVLKNGVFVELFSLNAESASV